MSYCRKYLCVERYRDNKGRITHYRLEDTDGNKSWHEAGGVKCLIKNNKIEVENLTLTSNDRLVYKECKEKRFENKYEPLCDEIATNVLKKMGYGKYIDNMMVAYDDTSIYEVDKRYGFSDKILITEEQTVVYLSLMMSDIEDIFYISLETEDESNYFTVETSMNKNDIEKAIKKFLRIVKGNVGLYQLQRIV